MNLNSNQQLFEEFQRSVDKAHTLAMKLAPEHFSLAYERCAKLQKVIFKRACGYCSTNDVTPVRNEIETQELMKQAPFKMCYMNVPTLSLCYPHVPVVQSNNTMSKSSYTPKEILIENVILLKQIDISIPSQSDINELERNGNIVHNCSLQSSQTVLEAIKSLLNNFKSTGNLQYEMCLPQTDSPDKLQPLQDNAILSDDILRGNTTIFLRQVRTPNEIKLESSLSPLSFANSDGSTDYGRINSFIMDTETNAVNNDNGFVFPKAVFSPMDIEPYFSKVAAPKPQRKYNWSVIMTKLHEKMPVELNHEVLPCPDKCHELHLIPPTTQKLRPTKRCQLCLKGYRSRKESRYYCRACDKGFHIKCFEIYHGQVGCEDFKVKIISADH